MGFGIGRVGRGVFGGGLTRRREGWWGRGRACGEGLPPLPGRRSIIMLDRWLPPPANLRQAFGFVRRGGVLGRGGCAGGVVELRVYLL